jgi:hypothetical protein
LRVDRIQIVRRWVAAPRSARRDHRPWCPRDCRHEHVRAVG